MSAGKTMKVVFALKNIDPSKKQSLFSPRKAPQSVFFAIYQKQL